MSGVILDYETLLAYVNCLLNVIHCQYSSGLSILLKNILLGGNGKKGKNDEEDGRLAQVVLQLGMLKPREQECGKHHVLCLHASVCFVK